MQNGFKSFMCSVRSSWQTRSFLTPEMYKEPTYLCNGCPCTWTIDSTPRYKCIEVLSSVSDVGYFQSDSELPIQPTEGSRGLLQFNIRKVQRETELLAA